MSIVFEGCIIIIHTLLLHLNTRLDPVHSQLAKILVFMLRMDPLFIGRKKSAGRSVQNRLFGTVLFDQDSKVEDFVEEHPTTRRANKYGRVLSVT